MATGRTRFYSECQCAYVEFTYVLPNDLQPIMMEGNPYYKRPMKTLYLLHGFTGNDRDWEFNGMAEDLAVRYNLAIFMISAGNNFYLDRAATGAKYGEFAGKEMAPLYMAIGLEDFLYEENQIMRKFLEKEHAHFKYEEGHGIHDWNFWNAYITKGLEYVLKEIESEKAQA